MSHCGCSHCDCDDDDKKLDKAPEEKLSDLKKAIEDLGYKVEEGGKGEIRVSE